MTATNHALTGAIIGLVVGQPLVAVPAAVASHFVCDAIPHFGTNLPDKILLKMRDFRNYLVADAAVCGLLVAILAYFHPEHWLLAAVCAFVAAAPDMLKINQYLKLRRGRHWQPGTFARFATKIQWFERPIGATVEVAWFAAAVLILLPFFS